MCTPAFLYRSADIRYIYIYKKKYENENDNDNEKKKLFYIVNNSTNFDFFAVLIPPKTLCVASLQHFND